MRVCLETAGRMVWLLLEVVVLCLVVVFALLLGTWFALLILEQILQYRAFPSCLFLST